MLSDKLILCRPLLLQPSLFPSIRVFPNDLALCIRWPKYWSLSFKVCPSNEYSRLISFKIDWYDLPSVQRTLKGLLHHCNSKASVLQCSAFIVQLAYLYMIIEKKKAKCKSKPQWGIISCRSERPSWKRLQTVNAGEGVEKREPSYTVGGNAICTATWENSEEIP